MPTTPGLFRGYRVSIKRATRLSAVRLEVYFLFIIGYMDIFVNIILLIVGFALLVLGANWFVDGASGIAKKARISSMVIGLTVVAMGTSAPEAAVTITGAVNGSGGIAIGNILGSNIINIALILGLASVIRPMRIQKMTMWIEIPFLILISGVFMLMGYLDSNIDRIDGAILLVVFIAFLVYTVMMAKRTRTPLLETGEAKAVEANRACVAAQAQADKQGAAQSTESNKRAQSAEQAAPKSFVARCKALWQKGQTKIWFVILLTVVGLGMVVGGSIIAVDAAKFLARAAGVTERIIGLTIVALGTSLPELFTSVVAAAKGNSDIAIGNIVGSNVFNLLLVGGLAAVITPIPYESGFLIDNAIYLGAVVLLFFSCLFTNKKNRRLNRIGGAALLVSLIGYYIYLFI